MYARIDYSYRREGTNEYYSKAQFQICDCGSIMEVINTPQGECPKCGGSFGHIRIEKYASSWSPVPANDKEIISQNELLALFQRTGEAMFQLKEDDTVVQIEKSEVTKQLEFRKYVLVLRTEPVLSVVRLTVNGEEVRATKTNIKRALSKIKLNRLEETYLTEDKTCNFVGLMSYVSRVLGTESIPEIVMNLFDYPVFDSMYNRGNDSFPTRMAERAFSSDRAFDVQRHERSMKKAFNLPKSIINYSKTKAITLDEARVMVSRYHPEKVIRAAQLCARAIGLYDRALAELLISLKPSMQEQMVKYLSYDTFTYQGIQRAITAWQLLKDYRRMSIEMNAPVKLFPKSLKLSHDIATMNYKILLSEEEKARFQHNVEQSQYASLQWLSPDKKWAVITPKAPEDLILEGRKLHHCVGSYTRDVSSGAYRICFLRKTEDIDSPVLTLTVNTDNECIYYKGSLNRGATPNERAVLEKWTTAKKLKMGAVG